MIFVAPILRSAAEASTFVSPGGPRSMVVCSTVARAGLVFSGQNPVRHAEKPGSYNGAQYAGVNNLGTGAGVDGAKHLVTLGWERTGALVTLFVPPWGPKTPSLATPQFLFASDPTAKHDDDTGDEGPSQRPYETLTALAAKLGLPIDTSHGKSHYAKMVTAALACDGTVLIAWQHEDIALTTKTGARGSARRS